MTVLKLPYLFELLLSIYFDATLNILGSKLCVALRVVPQVPTSSLSIIDLPQVSCFSLLRFHVIGLCCDSEVLLLV